MSSSQRIQGIPNRQSNRGMSSSSSVSDSTTQDIELTPINRNLNRVLSNHGTVKFQLSLETIKNFVSYFQGDKSGQST